MYQQTAPGKTNNWAMFEVRQTQLTAPLRNFLTLVLSKSLFEVVGREKEPRLLPYSAVLWHARQACVLYRREGGSNGIHSLRGTSAPARTHSAGIGAVVSTALLLAASESG